MDRWVIFNTRTSKRTVSPSGDCHQVVLLLIKPVPPFLLNLCEYIRRDGKHKDQAHEGVALKERLVDARNV